MSNEVELMREMWRLGYSEPNGVTLPCPDQATATRLRFALYNSVKAFRNGKGEADQTLRDALNNCQLSIDPQTAAISISRKLNTAASLAMLSVLGNRPIRTTEQAAADESLARVMSQLNTLAPAQPDPMAPINPGSKYGARG